MNPVERLTITRILKVNHAGEYGAIRIYRAQVWLARRFYPDIVAFLEETLMHELRHCAMFRATMPEWGARPCRIMALWGRGGFILGLLTSLLGRQGIWICTAAVESTVHGHLEDQLHFLRGRDENLCSLILSIQQEEAGHLRHAREQIRTQAPWGRWLNGFVSGCTDWVIWLSTWGTSSKMRKELAAARAASTAD